MAIILVVDDEVGIRELLSEILIDEGYDVRTAQDAVEAKKIRAELRPDLVLLDIWMPDTDGVTLLKEWQRDGMLTMPVIMMSGHATIDTAVEATRIGALNFLEKPISLQKLLKAVQQGLSRGQEPVRPTSTFHARPALTAVTADARVMMSHPVVNPPQGGITLSPAINASATLMSTDTHLFSLSFDLPLREARDAFERAYFEHHLQHEGGSMTRVAEKTGLERTHLYRKLKQLRVEPSKLGKKSG